MKIQRIARQFKQAWNNTSQETIKILIVLITLELLVFGLGSPEERKDPYGDQPPAFQPKAFSWQQLVKVDFPVLPSLETPDPVPEQNPMPTPEPNPTSPLTPSSETGKQYDPATMAALEQAKSDGFLILINKEYGLTEEDQPDDLTSIRYYAPDRSASSRYLRAKAAEQFHLLVEAAAADDLTLAMTTAYRSYEFQKILYDNNVARKGEEEANRISAKPGHSEHQSGLAVDVSSPSADYQLTESFGDTKEGIWLRNHAHTFGFIIRYPKDGTEITGYNYEPWHLRYVGETAATLIQKEGLTLEEFLTEYESQ